MCRTILFCEDEGRGSVGKHDENRTENDDEEGDDEENDDEEGDDEKSGDTKVGNDDDKASGTEIDEKQAIEEDSALTGGGSDSLATPPQENVAFKQPAIGQGEEWQSEKDPSNSMALMLVFGIGLIAIFFLWQRRASSSANHKRAGYRPIQNTGKKR